MNSNLSSKLSSCLSSFPSLLVLGVSPPPNFEGNLRKPPRDPAFPISVRLRYADGEERRASRHPATLTEEALTPAGLGPEGFHKGRPTALLQTSSESAAL